MRKQILAIGLLTLGSLTFTTINAQTSVLTEGFENPTFPPTGWTNNLINLSGGSGVPTWYAVNTGSNPSCSPHGGSTMASYNIYSINSGSRTELVTPPLTLPVGSEVSFWMYRDGGYLGYNEGVKIYYNTSVPTYSGGVLLTTINRTTDMPPTETANGWYKYSAPIPVSGSNIYIVFEGFSAYGNNVFIDDIDIYYFCNKPATVTASNVQKNSATLSWASVAASAGYEYALDEFPADPTYAGTKTLATSASFSGLTSGTTYYMHVRNKCVSGAFSEWATTTFTTPAGPSCQGISSLSANPVTSTSVNLNWAGASSSAGYEYVVDDKPVNPVSGYIPTGQTNLNVYGLTPLTTYYAHVRNVCTDNYSAWTTVPFITPDCSRPTNILSSGITSHAVDLLWSLMPNVQQYEYMVDQSPVAYLNPVNAVVTSGITAHVQSLLPDTKYYAFVRSRCFSGLDSSEWKIDSFVTYYECSVPDLKVTNIATLSPTGTWAEIPKAIAYEYKLTNSTDKPAFGTEIHTPSVTVTLPGDGKPQFLHVRAKCNSMFNYSEWATAQLRTTGVGDIEFTSGGIQVYPNPVKDKLYINTGSEEVVYSIADITGRVVLKGTIKNSDALNLAPLANGTYLLKCIGNAQTAVIKLIKE